MKQIQIYTDGSCRYGRKSTGVGGYGVIIIESNKIIYKEGKYFKNTTHNRMEILATIRGMEIAHQKGFNNVVIYSDSKYTVDGSNKWLQSWRQRKWKTKAKTDVKNKDLWERVHALRKLFKHCKCKWVKSHNNDRYNELVDHIATNHNKNTNYQVDDFKQVKTKIRKKKHDKIVVPIKRTVSVKPVIQEKPNECEKLYIFKEFNGAEYQFNAKHNVAATIKILQLIKDVDIDGVLFKDGLYPILEYKNGSVKSY